MKLLRDELLRDELLWDETMKLLSVSYKLKYNFVLT